MSAAGALRRLRRTIALVVGVASVCVAILLGRADGGITDNVYAIGYTTNSIYQVNLTDGTVTSVYTGYPITPAAENSAAQAIRASDGMMFYIAGTSGNGAVYRWNPATPATATWNKRLRSVIGGR